MTHPHHVTQAWLIVSGQPMLGGITVGKFGPRLIDPFDEHAIRVLVWSGGKIKVRMEALFFLSTSR
jgi:hypothetical protein